MKMRGLVPNFYIHVSVSNLYIPTIGPQTQYSKIGGPIVEIYKSRTDTLSLEIGNEAAQFHFCFEFSVQCVLQKSVAKLPADFPHIINNE